ncbi:MAG: NTP transferase domain-containing protein [Prevotella sp.]|nr:NTP transferase domain-containing protein [Prevotella sp.]
MKYAIIAAGEGSRLAAEGVDVPKPLVKINGECLIDRLVRIFMDNHAAEIVVICNHLTELVAKHLEHLQHRLAAERKVCLRLLVKTTPSSMHSFYEISKWMGKEPFVLSTVDTIFREEEFTAYVQSFIDAVTRQSMDGLMGVTDYVDDEKPLYVKTDGTLGITGFYDTNENHCRYVSGGIYGLTSKAVMTLNGCMERGESRMRNFQRALIRDGQVLKAYPFTKVLDIDHAVDIIKAEMFLKEQNL